MKTNNSSVYYKEPKERLQPELKDEILSKCRKFIKEYKNSHNNLDIVTNLTHDSNWKEPISKQKKVVDNIILALYELL